MMPIRNLVIVLFSTLLWYGLCGCQSFEPDFVPAQRLTFSTDTVFFDTLLTAVRPYTRRLVVRNPTNQAVQIQSVGLLKAEKSVYRLRINGDLKQQAQNLRLLARDSVLIVIEPTLQTTTTDATLLLSDSLVFEVANNRQFVTILAWGQNTQTLNTNRLQGKNTWKAGTKYLLTKPLLVDSLAQLVIEEGVEVFCTAEAGLIVKGSLQVNGTCQKPVVFRGTRLDGLFEQAVGMWLGIFFEQGTYESYFQHANISNATFGIRIGMPADADTIPELVIRNSKIQNMQEIGLTSFGADVVVENTQINNCIKNLVFCVAGGTYRFRHCTFANTQSEFFSKEPSVLFSNYFEVRNQPTLRSALAVQIENCIVWGDQQEELGIFADTNSPSNVLIRHSLLKTTNTALGQNNNILNQNPKFVRPASLNFRLDKESPALGKGLSLPQLSTDISCRPRNTPPDLGAWQRN